MRGLRVIDHRSLVEDAFCFDNIPIVAIETINCSLECLWDNKLLQDQINGAPLLDHISDELILTVVDPSV